MAVGTLSRDEIAAIFNSTEDYTQQANMAPYRPGLSREEIANFYNAPTASNTPAPAQPVSQPTQALPTLDPALAERERQMDEAKTIGRQALKYAQEGKLAQRDPAVSANEQRDIERAQKAQEEAAKRRESARTAQTPVEPAERVNNEEVEVPTNPNARLAKRPRKGAQGIDMGPDVVEATETKEQKNKGTFKNNLTAEDQARVEEINKDIARLSAHRSQVNDRRISGLQAERDQLIGQTLSQGRNDQADTMAKWLDPDYKMTDSEVEQAKQIISDYENTEYKNANVVDLTADEQARQSQINALRDKVSKERGAEYGSLNATVNPLLTLGDRDYYGWSVDDLRSEVESKGDIALSPEVQEYVDQLKGEIDGLQNTLNNKGTVYSTGDAAVDEAIGANTNMTEGDVRKTLEEKEMQMYKLMLEASRGNDQPDYDSYSFRKQNAQKQNPAAYFAGDLATRAIESAAIQGAAGSNGFGADILVDMATDTLPELSANKAAGMTDKEAWNQAGKNMLLNTLIDAGVWGLQNAGTIKSDFTNPPGGPPTLQPEVQPATVENLLKQNDVDVNAKIDNVNNAVDEIKKLDEQIPDVPEEVNPDDAFIKNADDYMAELRQAFDTADPATKAEMLVDGGYYDDMIEAGEAYQNGELDGAVEDFLAKMERNGDPTPAKRIVDSNTYDRQALKEQYGGNWEAMRRGTIKEYTGVDDAKADEYYDALRRFVGGGYPGKNDTAILDDYISKAPTYQGQITRGMHFNPEDGSYDEFMKQVHDSGTVTLGKPSSWATNPDSARVYSHMGDDGVDSIEIVCNKNRTSSPIDFINGQGEDEVISSSNASWTVLNEETYTRPNGSRKTIIRVAETGDKTPPKDAVVMPDQNVEAPKQGVFSTPENPIPDASELPQGEQQTLNDILKLDTDNGGNVPPTNETDIPKPDMGFDPNDPYVVDPNAVRQQEMTPPSRKTRNSRLGTNTMRTLDGDEVNANDLSRGIYQYEPKENQVTMRKAGNRVAESPTKAYNEILSTPDEAFTAEDVDTSMMLRNKLKQDLAAAREAGDAQQTNYLQSQLDALTIRQRKAATNAGQVSQAWAKWSRDADGAVFASYNIASRQMEDALKNDPRLGEMAKKIADSVGDDVEKLTSDELWEQLANADLSKTGEDELSVQIQKIIRNVLDKEANARVKRNLQDRNIKKIADALAVELRQGEDIGETLDMLEQAGVTGFTGIDDSVEQEIRDLFDEAAKFGFNSKQRIELEDQAYARLAQELNLTGGFYDKVDSIRYFAMLANPKTHLRNVIGNYTFGQMTNFKDQLGGFLEDQVDKVATRSQARKAIKNGYEGDVEDLIPTLKGIDRTNTVIFKNGRDHDLYRAAFDDFDENAYRQLVHGDKYVSSERGIENAKNIWGYGKAGSTADRVMKNNSAALEAEDVFFKRQKYADALTRYLKANGADESVLLNDITDPATLDLLDRARKFAAERAEEATFQQKNSLADSLSRFSKEARNIDWSDAGAGQKAKKLAGLFLDATIPFKKTPLNILTSVGEYSPLQLWNVGQDLVGLAKHQQGAANKLIDDIAKTATGTSLLAAGYGLAKSGFITGGTDKDTSELDDLTGKQDYALNLGDLGSYTLDWLSPSLTVLLAGANLFESGLSAEGFSQMISNIGEPVLETTMLSSLVDVLRSAQYAKDPMDTLVQAGATAGKNLATQFVPSELGNIARSIDNTRRSSYTDQTGVKGILDRTRRSVMNKLPGLSMLSEPYIDRWGEVDTNLDGAAGENGLARLAYNHLSPGYYSPEETSPREDYLYSLNEQLPQPDEKLFPGAFGTSITVNGETRKVTPEEKTIKDTAEGTARGELVDAVMNDPEIQALSPELQTKIVEDMYEVAKHVGKNAIIDGYTTDDTAYNIYASNDGDIPSLLEYEKDLRNPYGLKADAYKKMQEAGEDPSVFEGYPEALEEYGLTDNEDTRTAWKDKQGEGLQEVVDYNKAFADAGMDEAYTSESAHKAYEDGELEQYKDYRAYIKEKELNDTLNHWEQFKSGQIGSVADEDKVDWSQYGLTYKFADEGYAKAKSALSRQLPSFNPEQYATMFKAIDGMEKANNGITQNELIKYFNAEDLPLSYGQAVWNAFGKTSGSNKWKKGPVYEDGEWKLKSL